MSIEGQLTIDLFRDGHAVERAEIASSRPVDVARVFEGKSVDELLGGLPLMFNVCAVAQARATVAAAERASGATPSATNEAARNALVLAETAREHLLRIALDWPGRIGEEIDKPGLAGITAILPAFTDALFDDRPPFRIGAVSRLDHEAFETALLDLETLINRNIFGESSARFLARRTQGDIEAWAKKGETCPARVVGKVIMSNWSDAGSCKTAFLPALDGDELAERLHAGDAAGFTARPEWQGRPCETTVLARRRDHPLVEALLASSGPGLLTRLTALLVELAKLPAEMRSLVERAGTESETAGEARRSTGQGLAQIEAARGRLVHAVSIEDGLVVRYRILAPTEWNFHPAGAAARGLQRLAAGDEESLESQARLLIEVIDPCVGYELKVH